MKIRNGFVSNSSSSSFVINNSTEFKVPELEPTLINKKLLVVPHQFGGETCFGRQRENYRDFGSRLNFAYLIAHSIYTFYEKKADGFRDGFFDQHNKLMKKYQSSIFMLEEVLKETFGFTEIKWLIKADDDYEGPPDGKIGGYIDHQSTWYERPGNIEHIFKDKQTLYNWLFGTNNYIANRSDEYGDAGSLEVDHRFDYDCDYKDENGDYAYLHYSPYSNPEKFDKNGNFIG